MKVMKGDLGGVAGGSAGVTDLKLLKASSQEDRTQTFMLGSQTHTTKHAPNPEGWNCLGTLERPYAKTHVSIYHKGCQPWAPLLLNPSQPSPALLS